jgi:hypothetical protein
VPSRSVSKDVPDSIQALLAQHFYEAGNTGLLYLFQRSEVRGRRVQRWDFLYPAAWASDSLAKHSSGLVRL